MADIQIDGYGNYIYEAVDITNYDGDSFTLTVRKKWDFGFGIHCTQAYQIKTRIKGIDTPELRDDRPDWKAAGHLAKAKAAEFVKRGVCKFVSMDKLDKYGRALGDFVAENGDKLSDYLFDNHLAVRYEGQNKAEIEAAHEANIERLKSEEKI